LATIDPTKREPVIPLFDLSVLATNHPTKTKTVIPTGAGRALCGLRSGGIVARSPQTPITVTTTTFESCQSRSHKQKPVIPTEAARLP